MSQDVEPTKRLFAASRQALMLVQELDKLQSEDFKNNDGPIAVLFQALALVGKHPLVTLDAEIEIDKLFLKMQDQKTHIEKVYAEMKCPAYWL
jgi:hypothetical protein